MTHFGPLLKVLNSADVAFVVIGPSAARSHGVDISELTSIDDVLEITPSPEADNLARLAEALAAIPAGSGLPIDDIQGQLSRLTAGTLHSQPIVQIATSLGDLAVVMNPNGGPATFRGLMDATEVRTLDGVLVRAPNIEALLRGLASGTRRVDPELTALLRRASLKIRRTEIRYTAEEPDTDDSLTADVLNILLDSGTQMSVRTLHAEVVKWRRVSYRNVKVAVESLVRQGKVERGRHGSANVYSVDGDLEGRLAQQIAQLLAGIDKWQSVIERAQRLRSRQI